MDEHFVMTMTPSMEKFIAGWAEMACKWSVNRTVAAVHALFYLSENPLSAEEVSRALSVSRSNVSASLRELEGRALIRPVHVRGDRKLYYEATKDPWEAFRTILDDHKRRVIDPAIDIFQSCLDEHIREAPEDAYTAERMREVVSFFAAVMPLYEELRRLPSGSIENLSRVTAMVREILG
ncbi:MAG: MarR family transcriptional regulator [Acidobacteriota bacterium]